MDSSLLRAGRTTHLKIVTVALTAAIAVVVVGINARINRLETANAPDRGAIVKADQPATYAGQKSSTIR